MRLLVVGSGAREHALCWHLRRSPSVRSLFCAPGNPGTARVALNRPCRADDVSGVVALARAEKVDLVVVGPEAPLCAGLADALERERIAVFGPSAAAARLEGSKAFAKSVMLEAGVATARFAAFDDPRAAVAYASAHAPVAVKADGLAAGKGVVLCASADEARAAVEEIMVRRSVGEAGARVVVEELLHGEEASAIALCDGERYLLLEGSRDHKRLCDGDRGPNTGGMGAVSPTVALPPELADRVGREIVAPVLAHLRRQGTPFRGALYVGLMIDRRGPRVLEFNCRFGDPETQPLMLRFEGDLADAMRRCAAADLRGARLAWRADAAVAVVLAAAGYPSAPRTGDPIAGIEEAEAEGCVVFHAGTRLDDGRLVTAGGRVLSVCAAGASHDLARAAAYAGVERIRFEGRQVRSDIGARESRRKGDVGPG